MHCPPPYALPHWQVTVHQKCDIGADGSKLWPKRFYSCPDDLTHCPAPVTRVTLQVHPGAHLGASEGFTLQTSTHVRSCSPMDKAPDFWSGDCRFESCHGRYLLPFIFCPPLGSELVLIWGLQVWVLSRSIPFTFFHWATPSYMGKTLGTRYSLGSKNLKKVPSTTRFHRQCWGGATRCLKPFSAAVAEGAKPPQLGTTLECLKPYLWMESTTDKLSADLPPASTPLWMSASITTALDCILCMWFIMCNIWS